MKPPAPKKSPLCSACGKPFETISGRTLCRACYVVRPKIPKTCDKCAKPFETWDADKTTCGECIIAAMEAAAGIRPKPQLTIVGPSTVLPAPVEIAPPPPADMSFVDAAPGLLGTITRWITQTAVSPQPFLSLGAALAAIGTIAGHNYRLEHPDTRSNIYVLALASSGAGKDHPRHCVRELLYKAGLENYLGGESIMSGSGLREAVTEHSRLLYLLDEYGQTIGAALDQKQRSYHMRDIVTLLTKLWTSATGKMRGADYANRELNQRTTIDQPCVCLYGTTVPLTFWAALTSSHTGDGTLGRYLVFETPLNHPDIQHPAAFTDGMDEIVVALQTIAAGVPAEGNLVGHVISPHVVPLDADAQLADNEVAADQLERLRASDDTEHPVHARFREQVRRLALIAAVADNPAAPTCTAAHYNWATTLARHCQHTLLASTKAYVSDTLYQAQLKRVHGIIKRHGGWMNGHVLSRRLTFLNRRDRSHILADLTDMGVIEVRDTIGKTNKQGYEVRAIGSL